jgi:hypothetical protein
VAVAIPHADRMASRWERFRDWEPAWNKPVVVAPAVLLALLYAWVTANEQEDWPAIVGWGLFGLAFGFIIAWVGRMFVVLLLWGAVHVTVVPLVDFVAKRRAKRRARHAEEIAAAVEEALRRRDQGR